MQSDEIVASPSNLEEGGTRSSEAGSMYAAAGLSNENILGSYAPGFMLCVFWLNVASVGVRIRRHKKSRVAKISQKCPVVRGGTQLAEPVSPGSLLVGD
jgi:hypothetical protein